MLGSKRNFLLVVLHISAGFAGPPCFADESAVSGVNGPDVPSELQGIWDASRYIGLDEIRPGAEAYCLTEYGAAGIERFELEVIDVVRNMAPGKDAIMVRGLDERFVRTGPVSGCSGSPVYIDGRLAGALAFTWPYAKEPLYGATPIAEMLMVGRGGDSQSTDAAQAGFAFDLTVPIDLAEIDGQLRNAVLRTNRGLGGANYLPCLLGTTGLPVAVSEQLRTVLEPAGFMVVAAGGGGNI
ncbi:MAG: SpoIVB peptidase S55 domain-containing protein, partial [Planctomycetota bacterium]